MAIEEPQEPLLRTLLVGLSRRDVVKSQIRELAEEREIGLEVRLETGETPKAGIDEREGNHRGRRARDKKHRELVHEIAVGKFLPDGPGIALHREIFLADCELLGEVANLLLLGFEELVVELSENEIERGEPGTDVFGRVFATEADIILADSFVEVAGEKMVDLAVAQTGARGDVAFLEQLSDKGLAPFSRLALDEANKLLTSEVARMCADKVEETGLVIGVAERAESDDVHAGDIHRAKILAVISCVSRTRRSLGWSCCRANNWNQLWPSRRVPGGGSHAWRFRGQGDGGLCTRPHTQCEGRGQESCRSQL